MNLAEQSIKLIKNLYDPKVENIIAFSGGKDSVVLYHLAKATDLKFTYVYSNTTIDPPGHIGFIRSFFPDVIIKQPKKSFYQIIEHEGLPSRHRRQCCHQLKEYIGKGSRVFEGVRIDEGVLRGKRLSALLEPESCDTRIKGKIHAYPMLNWTTNDVWKYTYENHLPWSPWYDLGFERLGCVGCPLTTINQRIRGYKINPRYVYATIKAIKKNIDKGGVLKKFFDDPYEAFHWWISEQSVKEHRIWNQGLIKINYEEEIKKMFPLKKKDYGKDEQ